MEIDRSASKVMGVVLDLSLRHGRSGERLIDGIKRELVTFIKNNLEEAMDGFYLYNPDTVEIVWHQGDMSCAVGNYETDGWLFNLNHAFQQTLYVIGGEDMDFQKEVIVITDRLRDCRPVETLLFLNEKDMVYANITFVAVGSGPDTDGLEKLLVGPHARLERISKPEELNTALNKENDDA